MLRLAYMVCNRVFLGKMAYELLYRHAVDFGENLRATFLDLAFGAALVEDTLQAMVQPVEGLDCRASHVPGGSHPLYARRHLLRRQFGLVEPGG
jgi:hypothetical protein